MVNGDGGVNPIEFATHLLHVVHAPCAMLVVKSSVHLFLLCGGPVALVGTEVHQF